MSSSCLAVVVVLLRYWMLLGGSAVLAFHGHSHFWSASSQRNENSNNNQRRQQQVARRTPSCYADNTKLGYSLASSVMDISERAPREMSSLMEWATNYGVQTAGCFQLASSQDEAGADNVYAITNQDLPQQTPVLYVPNDLMLTGSKAREEFGGDADSYTAEQMLVDFYGTECLSQFYLFLKILKEYELGATSPWFPWLNSLPRYFCNGASMTDFCYGCLPPYAAGLALAEKTQMKLFVDALGEIQSLSSETKSNTDLTKWAFAVMNTRCLEMPNGDRSIAPMADYFNHGGYDEVNIYLSYDDQGNCYAYSARDIPAGSPLRISYGDSTNPSKLLARYGFLDDSSPATYCKYVIDGPTPEMSNMGYPEQMLFYSDGGISSQVWDILLYEELGKTSPDQQQAFYQAYMTGDEATKQGYHGQYFPQTLQKLQKHVDFLANELEELEIGIETQANQGRNANRHPRLPLLMKHNEFVKAIFERVQQNLDSMSY